MSGDRLGRVFFPDVSDRERRISGHAKRGLALIVLGLGAGNVHTGETYSTYVLALLGAVMFIGGLLYPVVGEVVHEGRHKVSGG